MELNTTGKLLRVIHNKGEFLRIAHIGALPPMDESPIEFVDMDVPWCMDIQRSPSMIGYWDEDLKRIVVKHFDADGKEIDDRIPDSTLPSGFS